MEKNSVRRFLGNYLLKLYRDLPILIALSLACFFFLQSRRESQFNTLLIEQLRVTTEFNSTLVAKNHEVVDKLSNLDSACNVLNKQVEELLNLSSHNASGSKVISPR